MNMRTIIPADYTQLIEFWKQNYFVNDMDNIDRFTVFLNKNPDLSVLMEDDGIIIGTVLGSFDGRRGYLQKVVTHTRYRKTGVARQLIMEIIKRFRALGVLYIPVNVGEETFDFYEKCGFQKTKQISMSMTL